MNKFDNLSAVELRCAIERIWSEVGELRSQCFLLHNSIEDLFVLGSSQRNDGLLTLQVHEERSDATLWLSGAALDGARRIEGSFDALFAEVEP